MTREVERHRSQDNQQRGQQYKPTDPVEQAYRAGMELAQRAGFGGAPGSEVAPVNPNGAASFDHPFFKQGQNKRVQRNKRSVHVIGDNEYILTEETEYTETLSFGDDIFMK